MTVTDEAYLVRKMASSMAESPPPTTASFLSSEEKAVARCTCRKTTPHVLPFVLEAEHLRRCACGNDDRPGFISFVFVDFNAKRMLTEIHSRGVAADEFSTEFGGLSFHGFHQVRSHDAIGEPGEVFDHGGEGKLAAGLIALNDERLQVGARCTRPRSTRPVLIRG